MSVSRHFIFLEFSDPIVRSLLTNLRNALHGAIQRDPVHVTVRGPYKDVPKKEFLETKANVIAGDFVLLADIGMFETRKGYAIFLNAQSRIFDAVWWKPDFKAQEKKPHVTLFETGSYKEAVAVHDFLKSEKIEIVTSALDLTVYTSKQSALFNDLHASLGGDTHACTDRLLVKPGIIDRASMLRELLKEPELNQGFQLALV